MSTSESDTVIVAHAVGVDYTATGFQRDLFGPRAPASKIATRFPEHLRAQMPHRAANSSRADHQHEGVAWRCRKSSRASRPRRSIDTALADGVSCAHASLLRVEGAETRSRKPLIAPCSSRDACTRADPEFVPADHQSRGRRATWNRMLDQAEPPRTCRGTATPTRAPHGETRRESLRSNPRPRLRRP